MMRTTITKTTKKRTRPTPDVRAARRGPARRRERGVALILVLWTFAAIAVLAAEFARAMHDEAASTRNFKESTRARMVAIAGLNEAILAMQGERDAGDAIETIEDDENPDPVHALSQGDSQWVPATWRGNRFEVRVTDEAGKISLNRAAAENLRLYFENLEIPEGDAEIIADSIVDWRDDDDFHLPNGAESDYYEGLDRPYKAKNAGFDTVEELLLVRGVTREYFYGGDGIPGLRDIFSVYTRANAPNLRSVTPEVMIAITGLDREAADQYNFDRRKSDNTAALDELRNALTAAGTNPTNKTPTHMTIETRVYDSGGTAVLAHIGAVVNMSNNGDGLRLFRWYDSIFDDSDTTTTAAETADN
jgi:hypothetical protein